MDLGHVLERMVRLSPNEYQIFCDTIDRINGSASDILCTNGLDRLIEIGGFFYPDSVYLWDGCVIGEKAGGAYFELYNIFAVNQTSGKAWAMYYGPYDTEQPKRILPETHIHVAYQAIQSVMKRTKEQMKERREERKRHQSLRNPQEKQKDVLQLRDMSEYPPLQSSRTRK